MAPIQKGDKVLVTGSNGYIASHIVDILLSQGYLVRGTVRSLERSAWSQKYFDNKYGKGKLELVEVKDFGVKGAYHDAMQDISGIAHVAGDVSFSADPNAVIPGTIAGVRDILLAANKIPSIKRFVLTSSSTAALTPQANTKLRITKDSWNTSAIEQAWAPPPYESARAWSVYSAGKTQGEQELWKVAAESTLHFEISSVLPNANLGRLLDDSQKQSSTPSWITGVYNQKSIPEQLKNLPPQWMVNVVDTARLHVVALTDPDVKNERIFAFGETYNWDGILQAARRIKPEAEWPLEGDGREDLSEIVPRERAEEILKRNFGEGFRGLEETLREQLESY